VKLVCAYLSAYMEEKLPSINLDLIKMQEDAAAQQTLKKFWEREKLPTKCQQTIFLHHLHDRCLMLKKLYEKGIQLKKNGDSSLTSQDSKFFEKAFGHFLKEVSLFARQGLRKDWSSVDQGFLCLGNEGISANMLFLSCGSEEEARKKTDLNVSILDKKTAISSPERLRIDLAPALDIESSKMINILQRGTGYVLTPDFALKLFVLNERRKIGIPTIFCGDTGVGKVSLFLPSHKRIKLTFFFFFFFFFFFKLKVGAFKTFFRGG